MRLRKPCEHGVYDAHRSSEVFPYRHCPGGEFLPEDALVIEKVEGLWEPRVVTLLNLIVRDLIRSNKRSGEVLPLIPSNFIPDTLDALATQVGKSG